MPGPADTLDDAGAVGDNGQGRPGRLTGIAAGGSVARLVTVSVSGQPRSLAAAARASPAVSASTTQARTTSQRPVLPESRTTGPAPSRHDQPTSGRPYHSGLHRAGNGQVGDSQRDGDGRRTDSVSDAP
jgi:hypothetical protein